MYQQEPSYKNFKATAQRSFSSSSLFISLFMTPGSYRKSLIVSMADISNKRAACVTPPRTIYQPSEFKQRAPAVSAFASLWTSSPPLVYLRPRALRMRRRWHETKVALYGAWNVGICESAWRRRFDLSRTVADAFACEVD